MSVVRSLLFVPGDSERKLAKALMAGSDAIILDLEDSVASDRKPIARELAGSILADNSPDARNPKILVRVNALTSGMILDDLKAVMPHSPDGIMMPKPDGPQCVRVLSNYLDALEAAYGLSAERTGILPVGTETAIAPFSLGSYADAGIERLIGLTWGAEDLSAAIGASTNKALDGRWADTYRVIRSLTLLAAHAADVRAIETLYSDFRDMEGLRATSVAARSEGFSGRLAIHPDQIPIINESFTPSAEEVDHARRVVAAFETAAGAATIGLDGRMLDIPHLKQARRTIQLAASMGRA